MRGGRLLALVLAAGIAGAIVLPTEHLGPEDRSDDEGSLGRTLQGRLAEGWAGMAADGHAGSRNGTISAELRGGTRSPRRSEAQAKTLHESALAALERGDTTRAVSLLKEAAARWPREAVIWNDLSVAHLEEADREERPIDLVYAYVAADRASRLDATLAAAGFNRAMSLTRLHVRSQAEVAWGAYLELDEDSPWSGRARQHLAAVEIPTFAERWPGARRRLVDAVARGDTKVIREIVGELPHLSRVAAEEESLAAWGTAVIRGDEQAAARSLAFVRAIGDAIQTLFGDAMVVDTVAHLDQAAGDGEANVLVLARGYAALGRGLRLYRRQEGAAAQPLLAEATDLLTAAGSPFAPWAEFYATVCTHYTDAAAALTEFERLAASTDTSRYPELAGHQHWMVGTTNAYLNRFEAALASYGRAEELLAATGEPERHGFVNVLFAEVYELLGEPEAAWRRRLAGLAAAAEGGDFRRLHSTLRDAAFAAARIAPEAAVPFAEELLASNREWGNTGALVGAHTLLGELHAARGRHEEARAAYTAARELAGSLGEGAQVEQIALEVAIAEGEGLVGSDPGRAVERLTEALASARDRDFGFDDRILLARARARRALGDLEAAKNDLEGALAAHESIRRTLASEPLRRSYFEGAQRAFDDMIALQALDRGAEAAAFGVAERARARLLLDMVTGTGDSSDLPAPLEAAEIVRRLGEGTVLVEYALLPDHLLAWIVAENRIAMHRMEVSAEALSGAIEALVSGLGMGLDEPEVRSAGAALYDLLVRPLEDQLPPGAPLVVVADRMLGRLPFAALHDGERYLVESRAVAVAPSATLFLAARERSAGFTGERTALAVGDPAFDRALHPSLGRLPGAADEAAAVAALYPGSALLRFEEATPEALVEAAGAHRVIHFSGHALLDDASPWRNRLVLAPGERGSSLDARQIAALDLPEAEIVVLSSCHSLPGGAERESFQGLAAAFFAAGPPVVVASLWAVDDTATRALMLPFHRHLRTGAAPAAALRQAQLELLRSSDPKLSHPSAWAAFAAFGGAGAESTTD